MTIQLPNGVVLNDTFYKRLIEGAKLLHTQPEDMLVVFASESGINPKSTINAPYKGINTIGQNEANAIGISTQEWQNIPYMSPEDNLNISIKYYGNLLSKIGRKGFANALDLYLSNAAYGIWASKTITPNMVMYPAGSMWSSNYPLDNYPLAAGKTLEQAKQMVQNGQLKGFISVDDLRRFMLRDNVKSIWQKAIQGLYDYMKIAGIATSGSQYQPVGLITPSYTPGTSYDDINSVHGGAAPEHEIYEKPGIIQTGVKVGIFTGIGYGLYRLVRWIIS